MLPHVLAIMATLKQVNLKSYFELIKPHELSYVADTVCIVPYIYNFALNILFTSFTCPNFI